MSKQKRTWDVILIVVMVLLCLLWIYPIVLILLNSLKTEGSFTTSTVFRLPTAETFAGLRNYVYGVTKMDFLSSMGYSLLITITSVVLILLCCSMTGWYLTRVNNKLSKFMNLLIVFSMVVPFQMVMFTLSKTADQLKLGDTVKILSMGMTGTVSSLPDHKGNLFIQCGSMRTQANIKNLVSADPAGSAEKSPVLTRKQSSASKMKMSKSYQVSPEINLLGQTVDEAICQLDKYLDDAYLAHLPTVRVVHGKGTGALRSAVQNHLKRVKYVKSYRLGEYGEGDAGVTIVTFKE